MQNSLNVCRAMIVQDFCEHCTLHVRPSTVTNGIACQCGDNCHAHCSNSRLRWLLLLSPTEGMQSCLTLHCHVDRTLVNAMCFNDVPLGCCNLVVDKPLSPAFLHVSVEAAPFEIDWVYFAVLLMCADCNPNEVSAMHVPLPHSTRQTQCSHANPEASGG